MKPERELDDGADLEPFGCPTCLRGRADDAPPAEDHVPALKRALRDVLDASLNTGAMETIPRALWLALRRADDVLADIDGIPF